MQKRFKYILVIFSIAIFTSCTKDTETPLPTFNEFVASKSDLSSFKAIVDKAGLQIFTEGVGPFTWIAPTNAAFNAAGITVDSINRMSQGAASYLMQFHLINANFPTLEMSRRQSAARTTNGGLAVYSSKKGDDFYLNGVKIASPDNLISSGVIHVMGSILRTPNLNGGNLQGALTNTTQNSLFIAAVTRANRWTSFSSSVFTVMAPTDAAMTAAGWTSTNIPLATVGRMDSLVRMHLFIGNRFFTSDFNVGFARENAFGAALQFSNMGANFKGNGNASFLGFTRSDILATNGVLHVIDGVIRP
jgi:uncharacterized surface protein with fasciclin (FAS1) repeats